MKIVLNNNKTNNSTIQFVPFLKNSMLNVTLGAFGAGAALRDGSGSGYTKMMRLRLRITGFEGSTKRQCADKSSLLLRTIMVESNVKVNLRSKGNARKNSLCFLCTIMVESNVKINLRSKGSVRINRLFCYVPSWSKVMLR
jgi:hypothetical protein